MSRTPQAGSSHYGGRDRLDRLLGVLAHLGGEGTVHQLHLRTGLAHGSIDQLLRHHGDVVEMASERRGVHVHDRRWRLRSAGE